MDWSKEAREEKDKKGNLPPEVEMAAKAFKPEPQLTEKEKRTDTLKRVVSLICGLGACIVIYYGFINDIVKSYRYRIMVTEDEKRMRRAE